MRSVLEADGNEFFDPNLHKLLESYHNKLLDEFKDTVFNAQRNIRKEIEANASKRGPDGCVHLKLKKDSKPVASSPIPTASLREEALQEKINCFEDRGWITDSSSPWVARGFLVPKPGVNKWMLVIDYWHLNSCPEEHEFPLSVIEDLL